MGQAEATDQRETWFHDWRRGCEQGFSAYAQHLRKRWWRTVYVAVRKASWHPSDPDPEHATGVGYGLALEELDLGVSAGQLMVRDGRGLVSDRPRKPKVRIEWLGGNQFDSLGRRFWKWRATDQLRPRNPDPVKAGTGFRAGFSKLLLRLTQEGDEPNLGEVSANALVEDTSLEDNWNDASDLILRVRFLAFLAGKLHRKKVLSDLVEATIWFIKQQVALCNPMWRGAEPGVIRSEPIERLIPEGADLTGFAFNPVEWRQFLLETLGIERAALDKRVKRFRDELPRLAGRDTDADSKEGGQA